MSETNDAALKGEELQRQLAKLEGWTLADGKRLEKEYSFPDFAGALAYVNRLGEAAERAGHHPDIFFTWGKVKVTLWTHDAGGVTAKDVALAAEADGVR